MAEPPEGRAACAEPANPLQEGLPPRKRAAAANVRSFFWWAPGEELRTGKLYQVRFSFPSPEIGAIMKRTDAQRQKAITDRDFDEMLTRAYARGRADGEEGDCVDDVPGGIDRKVIRLPARQPTGSLKLEQNLGCELPVCVANRRDVNKPSIDVVMDNGQKWSLERSAKSRLPAPEHYPYWLWFLDRLQAAAETGETLSPMIEICPSEVFDLFGSLRGGRQYQQLDEAFSRFSLLTIREKSAFFDGGREYETDANLGQLCSYRSWKLKPENGREAFGYVRGCIVPGALLWASVRAGYLKSVPIQQFTGLEYPGQRLLTYLSKHCRPNGDFAVSPRKLLPKIPMHCPANKIKHKLDPHHNALAKCGFLADAQILGRGARKVIQYRRSE